MEPLVASQSAPLDEMRAAVDRVLVVGGSGVVGRALLDTGRVAGKPMIGTGHRRGGGGRLRRFDACRDRVEGLLPGLGSGDCVYWLGAYTDPGWIARNPDQARRLNVEATLRGAEEVLEAGARLIFLSTELVFDGGRGGYTEEDPPSPSTEYGRQKLEVETWMRGQPGDWCLVRTGALVGWNQGENCPVTKTFLSLLEPGARMAWDNRFSLTDARDLARGLLRLSGASFTGIYHLVAPPPVVRTELARWVQEDSRFGDRMDFREVRFAEIPYPEPRPVSSWLACPRADAELGLAFTPPRSTVRAKVALLDQWYQEGGLR